MQDDQKTEAEFEVFIKAVDEKERFGICMTRCPRCNGKIDVDIRGNSFVEKCTECGLQLTCRGI